MKPNDSKLLAAVVCFVLGMLCLIGVFGGCETRRVAAQDEAAISALTPTLALARTAVREAGIVAYRRDDTAAIHAVIAFRAEYIYRTDYLTALRRATHNAPVRVDAPRSWITELLPNNRRPSLFPAYLRWEGVHDRHWRRTYAHARYVQRGDIEHRCTFPAIDSSEPEPATPHDWGSEHDSIVFRRAHPEAIELNCGQTCSLDSDGGARLTRDGLPRCNHFFYLPRYGERFGET